MPTQDSLEQIEIGELIVSEDDVRAAGDAFKLGTALRALVVARLADAKTKDAATFITEGGRAGWRSWRARPRARRCRWWAWGR